MKQSTKLEICLLNYFLLIAIAAMMIGIEFYFEMGKPGMQQEICSDQAALNGETAGSPDPEATTFSDLRNKIVIMFGVLTIVVVIVMMMFVKNITRPLQRTLASAKLINDGDLSQVVKIESNDEVGQLGVVINELTSNFQEIATSTTVMINAIETRLNQLSATLADCAPDSSEQISRIRQELDALRAFVDTFHLLQTDIAE